MNFKNISRKVAAVLAISSITLSSCVNDLDTEPIDPNATTANKVFADPANYINALAKLYAGFTLSGQQGPTGNPDIKFLDEGHGQYLRGYYVLQELPTDEAINGWNDGNLPRISQMTWQANNEFIRAFYYRAIYQVSLANEFLRNVPADGEVNGIQFSTMRAEARFIRAFAYWHALDLFGNGVPFVTEGDPVGAFLPNPAGLPGWGSDRRELFDFIVSEVKEIETMLPEPRTGELGRADKGAAYMLLSKLYLNAETYTGTAMWSEAEAELNKLVASGAYTLNPSYKGMFSADNHTSTETIFSFNFNALNTQTFGGMTYMIHAAVGGSMSAADFGINSGWGGNRALRELNAKFVDGADLRGPGELLTVGDDGGDIDDQFKFTQGYFVRKFTNNNADGTAISNPDPNGDHVDTDFPTFRYSDAVLMLAEAELKGSGSVSGGTLALINQIRTRAGVGTVTPTEVNSGLWILDERARELYWECHRRTDLIRWGQYTSGANWQYKGGTVNGTSVADYHRLMPIPSSDLNANPNLKQNEGY
ncbi:RagB/SusD family nutrient uptake outer membrane protein [Flammeovirga yaeyamensis]|nr:RagB/SusD family nutrient uptake outer membrane protein [Flammeovirga yaeyamensis]MBB3700840.1 hypothetical protein [Flammeovirga yaeyamensis]NMF37948.1 RagB/SusD family nutrient uptake outer membrane protein [Flammeovirga yaeyamensis]